MGKAIFSFEGLGEARVWKLPGNQFPMWGSFDRVQPPGTIYMVPAGPDVCQAEDLKVDGKWKRYFGLLSDKGAAVVPAEEFELWWPRAPWCPREELFANMFWGLTVPGPKPGFWRRMEDETPRVGEPMRVGFFLRNTRPGTVELPSQWYRDAQHGGPALLDAVTLTLAWAPFEIGSRWTERDTTRSLSR